MTVAAVFYNLNAEGQVSYFSEFADLELRLHEAKPGNLCLTLFQPLRAEGVTLGSMESSKGITLQFLRSGRTVVVERAFVGGADGNPTYRGISGLVVLSFPDSKDPYGACGTFVSIDPTVTPGMAFRAIERALKALTDRELVGIDKVVNLAVAAGNVAQQEGG